VVREEVEMGYRPKRGHQNKTEEQEAEDQHRNGSYRRREEFGKKLSSKAHF